MTKSKRRGGHKTPGAVALAAGIRTFFPENCGIRQQYRPARPDLPGSWVVGTLPSRAALPRRPAGAWSSETAWHPERSSWRQGMGSAVARLIGDISPEASNGTAPCKSKIMGSAARSSLSRSDAPRRVSCGCEQAVCSGFQQASARGLPGRMLQRTASFRRMSLNRHIDVHSSDTGVAGDTGPCLAANKFWSDTSLEP